MNVLCPQIQLGKVFGKGKVDERRVSSSVGSREVKHPRAAFIVFLIIEAAENTPVLPDIPEASPPAFPQITERGYFSGTEAL